MARRWRGGRTAVLLGVLLCAFLPVTSSVPGLRESKNDKTPGLRGGDGSGDDTARTRGEAEPARDGAGKKGAKGKDEGKGKGAATAGKAASSERHKAAAEGTGKASAANTDDGAKPLRPEDGDPTVGGRGRNTTCPVPDKELEAKKALAARMLKNGLKAAEGENGTLVLEQSFDEIYHNATALGDAECQFWLGRCFVVGATDEDGNELVAKDINQGAHLLHAAAEQNHLLAARELASLMEVHVDADRAAEIYLKAIEMGDVRSVSHLAGLYEDAEQMEEAVQLYQQAAQAGDALGMSQLARLLEQGKGVAEDRLGALKLYRQAAAAGDAVALNGMGGFYERGDVVAQDLAEAARLYVQSAEGGDAFGAANAARCFQLGIGVKQSSKEAEQWARAAAEKGIRGETLQAETDAAEMANLPRPLLGGRPSRYSYIPVADSELVSQNATEVAEDALYDGAGQIEGQIVRFRRAESPVYFKSPDVLWEIPAAAAAESGGAAAA